MQPRRLWMAALLILVTGLRVGAAERPDAEKFLHEGKLGDGETALVEHLKRSPTDDQARFGLGVLQFLRAVENLGQSLDRYGTGLNPRLASNIPFLRLPVPPNPNPEKLTYELSRKIFSDFEARLAKAEATLAGIKDDAVKLRLRLGLIRLDLNNDGKAEDPFHAILAAYLGAPAATGGEGDFPVAFDRGDVAWLRGYCHVLSGMCEFVLACDARDLFEHTAHLFFANPETPYKLLSARDERVDDADFTSEILDAVAVIHLMRLPMREPERMARAKAHFEKMLALSRESWKFILAETDDDLEWLPNPTQKGVLGVPIRAEQIDVWLAFVAEAEALLAGKKLAPFWRGRGDQGVNLKRVFDEPKTFDLVLWIQGSAALPYLEKGPLTDRNVWDRLMRVFGGELFGFALWFN
jgi:hypothetical protein